MTVPALSSGVDVRVEDGRDCLARARDPWRDLVRRAGSGYFQSWEWVTAWHKVFQPGADLSLVVAVGRDGEWQGLLPLAQLSRRLHRRLPVPLNYVGLAGSGPGAGDHLGPSVVAPALVELLARRSLGVADGRPLYFESVDVQHIGGLTAALGGRIVRKVACPRVELDADGPEVAWTPKVRKNIRRRERMLAAEGIAGRWVSTGGGVEPELTALQRVHVARWQARGQSGLFDDRRLEFLSELCRLSVPPDGPSLYLLEKSDGRVVAALLGFRHGLTFMAYKTGWDPEFAHLGPGIALHSSAMRRAHEDGARTFDFLRGQGSHKYSLGAVDREDVCLLHGTGLRTTLIEVREGGGVSPRRRAVGAAGR